jgi:phenylacetate-CoA ligase
MKRLYWTAFLGLHYLSQRGYPFRSREEILGDQARRLRRLLRHAARFVPYYRETFLRLGLKPEDFRSAEDLALLPVLERRDIQTDPERFHSSAFRRRTCYTIHSGGSTGAPIAARHELGAMLQTAAHGQRYQGALAEVRPGKGRKGARETWVFPSLRANVHAYRLAWRKHTLFDRRPLASRQYVSMTEPLEKVVSLINEYKPDIIHTHGSYLEELFAHLQATGTPIHKARAAGFGADGLSDQCRRLMMDGFGIPAFSIYASVEAPSIGFECREHRGIHINEDIYPVRIVDGSGRTLPPGERGEVVVSNLVNRAMVLLNYRLGDLAALLPGPCPCGRSLPMMSFPEGRRDDFLELPSGRSLTPFAVGHALRDEAGVLQYQLVQEAPLSFRISLVVREPFDVRAYEARAAAKLADIFGEGVSLRASVVPAIPRTASGKVRPIISMRERRNPGAEGPDRVP